MAGASRGGADDGGGRCWAGVRGTGAPRARLGARFAPCATAAPGGRPLYSAQPAQPRRSLSSPANMQASWEMVRGKSSAGVSRSKACWVAMEMQSVKLMMIS